MKQLSILFVAAMLGAGAAVQAQTVDEIVERHNEAMGGAEAWNKVSSIKMSGKVSTNGFDYPVIITKVKDKGFRQEFEAMGVKGFYIITPTAGWSFMPFSNEQTKPEPLTEEVLKSMQHNIEIKDALMDYAARGSKVEYVGKEGVEGTECYKLQVTDIAGEVTTLFIDPASWYIIREVKNFIFNGKEQHLVFICGDFQKLPEGIVVPMTIGGDMGNVNITKVEVNTIQDDSIFKP